MNVKELRELLDDLPEGIDWHYVLIETWNPDGEIQVPAIGAAPDPTWKPQP